MTTITDIRDQLIEVFHGLRAGTIAAKDAVELNNTAGKIISSAKAQIAYYALRGEVPNIPFLGAPGERLPGSGILPSPQEAVREQLANAAADAD